MVEWFIDAAPGVDDSDVFYEWASAHGPMELPRRGGGTDIGTLLMRTGRDKQLAMIRVDAWRKDKPQIESRLLRREVVRGQWREEVEDGRVLDLE